MGVVPQVTGQAAYHRERQDRPLRAVGVVRQQQVRGDVDIAEHEVEQPAQAEQRLDRQRPGEAVDAVRTVGGVDRDPDQEGAAGDAEPGRDGHDRRGERKPDLRGMGIAQQHGGYQRNSQVDKSLAVFVPAARAAIVQVAGDHGQRHAGQHAQIGELQRRGEHADDREHEAEHQPRAGRLAECRFLVHRELPASIAWQKPAGPGKQYPGGQRGQDQRGAGHDEVGAHQAKRTVDVLQRLSEQKQHCGGRSYPGFPRPRRLWAHAERTASCFP